MEDVLEIESPEMTVPEVPVVKAVNLEPGMREADIVAGCARQESEFQAWFKPSLDRFDENTKLLENVQAAGIKNAKGPVIPLTYSVTETMKSRLMAPVYGQEKQFDFLPEGEESLRQAPMVPDPAFVPDPMQPMILPPMVPDPNFMPAADVASIMEDFINEAIYDTPDFYQRMDNLMQNLILENTMCARLRWETYDDYTLSTVKDKKLDSSLTATSQEFKKKTRGCPTLEPVSLREMAWDPRARYNMLRARWVRKRTMTHQEELDYLEAEGTVENVGKIRQASQTEIAAGTMGAGSPVEATQDPQARQSKQVEGVNLPTGAWDGKLVQVDEWWAEITWRDEEGKSQCGDFNFWLADGKTIIKFERINPELKCLRRPFAFGALNQKDGQLLGLGPIDVIKPLLVDIANVMEQKSKLIWQTANSPIFVEPVSMLDTKRTLLEGMNLVPVLSAKNISRLPIPDAAIRALDQHLAFLITMVRESTASNEQAQGIGGAEEGTATEARILAASAGQRMQYISNMVNASFNAQVAGGYKELFTHCGLEGDMVTREAGVDGKPIPITYDMLKMRFKIRPVSSIPQANKLARFKLLKDTMLELAALPPGSLIDDEGQPMQVATYGFTVNDILPLIDVRGGQRLFKRIEPTGLMAGAVGPYLAASPGGEELVPAAAEAEAAPAGLGDITE